MISHSPTRLPTTINRLGQLIRFASTSLGTSTPAAAASASRSVLRKPFWDRAMRSVSGSSVERCKRVRTASIVSGSSTRQVEATPRSTPATTAGGRHRRGQVAIGPHGGRRRRGAPEIAQQRALPRGEDGLGAERAVRDPSLAEHQHGAQEAVEVVVADVVALQLRRVGVPRAAA